MPGMGELIILLVIVVVLFGPGKIKGIGPAIGRSIRGFKDEMDGEAKEPARLESRDEAREIDVTTAGSVERDEA